MANRLFLPFLVPVLAAALFGCRDDTGLIEPGALPGPDGPLLASHAENAQTIGSEGEDNEQAVTQDGAANEQVARIVGDNNAQDLTQHGESNAQSAHITGDRNLQTLGQDGAGSNQTARLEGDDNRQELVQGGERNRQDAGATGPGSAQTLRQQGEDNVQSAGVEGEGNHQVVEQDASDSHQVTAIEGTANQQTLQQSGLANEQSATVLGEDNTQTLIQAGSGSKQTVEQTGSGNRLTASSGGLDNHLSAFQNGSSLQFLAEQVGNGLGMEVVQTGGHGTLVVRGDVLGPAEPGPLFLFEQPWIGLTGSVTVAWTGFTSDLSRAGNTLVIHGQAFGADAVLDLTAATSSNESSSALVRIPEGESAAVLLRFADFAQSGDDGPADFSDIGSIGIHVSSDGIHVSIAAIEVLRTVQARATITPINISRNAGVVPAILFGSPELDVLEVDLASLDLLGMPVRSRPSGTLMVEFDDVDGDGHLDLVARFDQTGWTLPTGAGPEDAVITATLLPPDHARVIGSQSPDDPVRFTGQRAGGRP